jgi:hypothetical protein
VFLTKPAKATDKRGKCRTDSYCKNQFVQDIRGIKTGVGIGAGKVLKQETRQNVTFFLSPLQAEKHALFYST